MDGLALEIVLGVSAQIRTGKCLCRFVRLESQVSFLEFRRSLRLSQPRIAEHQVVVGLQVFGIDRKCGLEFPNCFGVAAFEKENSPGNAGGMLPAMLCHVVPSVVRRSGNTPFTESLCAIPRFGVQKAKQS